MQKPLKIFFHCIGMALFALLLAPGLWAEETTPGPQIRVSHQLEQGFIKEGIELRGELTLHNPGKQQLQILGVKPSCGCTTFHLPKNKLAPGETITIPFFIDTRGKVGQMEKTITIHHNGPHSPWVEALRFHVVTSAMSNDQGLGFVLEPPCAKCHLEPGIGKQGPALFQAICSMCHQKGITTRNPALLKTVIRQGLPQKGMPAYGDFLTKEQIESLVKPP